MKKRYRQEQIVESDRAPYPYPRSQPLQEVGSVRLSLLIGIVILGLLILGGVVLGVMSLADVIRGHPGDSWHHLTAWIDSIKGWLIAAGVGVVLVKVVLPFLEMHMLTAPQRAEAAVKRAEAKKIREEARRLRDIRSHNEDHMPDGYIPLPDALGNYGQVVHSDRQVTYLLPGNAPTGNAGINPKHLLDFMERQNIVDADSYEEEGEEEEPKRIAPPKILLSEQIERGLTTPDEEESVFGYPIDTYEPFRVRLFEREGNFINSLFIIGDQGQGKSAIGAYFAALTVNHRGYLMVIDPDAQEEQSLTRRLGPLTDFLLCEIADTPEKAKRLLILAENEIDTPSDFPLLLLVDEFSMIMRHKQLKGKWQEVADMVANTVENYATRGRKRRRRAIVFGQISNASRTGGTELRDVCAYIIFNTPYKKASLVLQDASDEEIAELAPSLSPGMGIVSPAKSSDTYIMQFTFPDDRGLQIIAEVRTESEEIMGSGSLSGGFQDDETEFHETETEDLKHTRNILEITPETAWKVKLRKVREMRGKNPPRSQKDILYAVWGVLPGGSAEYAKAREEYQQMITQLNSSEEIG